MASSTAAKYESSESAPYVQELIKKSSLTSVPECYIRLNDQKTQLTESQTFSPPIILPIINMQQLVSGEATQLELENLHSACRDLGFFQLVNHGVSPILLGKLKAAIEEFFKLPLEEKMKYKTRAGDAEGYGAVIISEGQELDWGDRFYMTTNPLHMRKPHLFPELPPSLRTVLDSYIVELQNLAMKLLGLLEKTLKIEKREIVELLEDGMQSVRMTYYPPCPQPELVMGLTAHSDGSGITILNQVNGVDGLQMKKDGVWVPVNVISDALVVNIGDVLEIMSNGEYKSVEHRATVNSDKERISVAMFFNPKFESEMGPVKSLTSQRNPPIFKSIGMDKYVKGFFSRKLDGKSYLELMKIKDGEATNPSV